MFLCEVEVIAALSEYSQRFGVIMKRNTMTDRGPLVVVTVMPTA